MDTWKYFCEHHFFYPEIGLSVDVSKIDAFDETKIDETKIFEELAFLESGGIANPDEQRMVGHYWLRNPSIAPTPELKDAITQTWEAIDRFVYAVHSGEIHGQSGKFKNVLCIGIGGSALGPQLVSSALSQYQHDKMKLYFIDNTDPDGIDTCLQQLEGQLGQTLVIVTSKSGGTPETRNGMLEVAHAYDVAELTFSRHAVAITCEGSKLDQQAQKEGWIKRFPMWDWVGGRTSVSSVVGLLPIALQGIDYKKFLEGMRDSDSITRRPESTNPALLLAKAWYVATKAKGEKAMVILPYKDRLQLLSKFLQQLIMESLGKQLDRQNRLVEQGITVYGNKGSTDQHAYVQQLRDGVNNFFVTFIEVLKDRLSDAIEIDEHVTTGDYLEGFLLGTRQALHDNRRESVTLSIQEIDAYYLGVLLALYERTVSFYATMINVNAYHQPGVEAGKKAANTILELQKAIFKQLTPQAQSVKEIADKLDTDDIETLFKLLEHLAKNGRIRCETHEDCHQNKYLLN